VRGRRRVWRKANEVFHHYVIRQQWKGFSEFMFWGSFSYYEKGPCHIWKPETAAKKQASKADLEERNAKVVAKHKRIWEEKAKLAVEEYQKKHGKNKGGPKPKWFHLKANGAIVQEKGRGGINWYQY
jgi:hypothetical protein